MPFWRRKPETLERKAQRERETDELLKRLERYRQQIDLEAAEREKQRAKLPSFGQLLRTLWWGLSRDASEEGEKYDFLEQDEGQVAKPETLTYKAKYVGDKYPETLTYIEGGKTHIARQGEEMFDMIMTELMSQRR